MSGPKPIDLTLSAKRDIAEILRYTLEEWGAAQAERYRAKIASALSKIEHNPETAAERPDAPKGYRFATFGSHVIIYVIGPNSCKILRVLHQRMDRSSHL